MNPYPIIVYPLFFFSQSRHRLRHRHHSLLPPRHSRNHRHHDPRLRLRHQHPPQSHEPVSVSVSELVRIHQRYVRGKSLTAEKGRGEEGRRGREAKGGEEVAGIIYDYGVRRVRSDK